MVRVCSGDVLPHAVKGKWYLLRAFGNAGQDESQQIWDVTDPSAPALVTTIISGSAIRIRTGGNAIPASPIWSPVAKRMVGIRRLGQHLKIYDLSDPAHPVYIREFGLVGQQTERERRRAKLHNNARPELLRGHDKSAEWHSRADLDGTEGQ